MSVTCVLSGQLLVVACVDFSLIKINLFMQFWFYGSTLLQGIFATLNFHDFGDFV